MSFLGNGERALLLRKVIGRIQVIVYRCITLLSVVGKVFCKVLKYIHCLDKGALHEGQAGFRVNSGCTDSV